MNAYDMKSLLVFLPANLAESSPGYIYGKASYDRRTQIKRFYAVEQIGNTIEPSQPKRDAHIIGYCSFVGYCQQTQSQPTARLDPNYSDYSVNPRPPDWICVQISEDRSRYTLTEVIVDHAKMSLRHLPSVILVYHQSILKEIELYEDNEPGRNHLHDLIRIVRSERFSDNETSKSSNLLRMSDALLFYFSMLFHWHPILLLGTVTNRMLPLLKYSALCSHIHDWTLNAKWLFTIVLKDGRFSLKTANYACALAIDILLGSFLLRFTLNCVDHDSPSRILLNNAEGVVESLKSLIHWLMGAPAGLKLNYALNRMLGKFFLYHIQLWWTFLIFAKPIMDFAFDVLTFIGRLGLTFQIAIAIDLLALVSFHTYCIYVYAARLFSMQLKGIIALSRLFLGKKKNPLRKRIDSCQYQPNQLFVGTLLFSILLFLMPTTWAYYAVFTVLRLVSIGCGGFLSRLKFHLQVMPIYVLPRWLLRSHCVHSIVKIQLLPRDAVQGQITLQMKTQVAAWTWTRKHCMPNTVPHNPSIEWNKILRNILWGELLYPL